MANNIELSVPTYGKVLNLGHVQLVDLLDGEVVVQEKVDGSQFSVMRISDYLLMRSKGATIDPADPPKMFAKAVVAANAIGSDLVPGVVYRFEFLRERKHVTLCYGREPKCNLVLLDVELPPFCEFADVSLASEAERLGVDAVPILWRGPGADLTIDRLRAWAEEESFLGGVKREGVVIKNYARPGPFGGILMGKYVREEFREQHGNEWKRANPGRGDLVLVLGNQLRTEARWRKAIQRQAEAGELANEARDIGPLIRAIQADVAEEERAKILEELWRWAWPQLSKAVIRGFPEWYKERLASLQFTQEVQQ